MINNQKINISIVGPYRYHNFGDDLMGAVMVKKLIKDGYKPIIPKLSIENCNWLGIPFFGSTKKAILESRGVIIGGGGILGDSGVKPDNYYLKLALKAVILCLFTRKNYIITGVGAGPLAMKTSKILTIINSLFTDFIGVRDVESRTFLVKLGVNRNIIVHGADIALLWNDILGIDNKVKKNKIGIQYDIGSYVNHINNNKSILVNNKLKNYLHKNKGKITVVTNGPYQSELTRELKNINEINYDYLPEFLKKLKGLKVILTSHLHLAIAAYAARIPCFSIYVREKTKRFYKQIGHPERAIKLEDATEKNISNILSQLEKTSWTDYDESTLIKLKNQAKKLIDFKNLLNKR